MEKQEKNQLKDLLEKYYEDEANDSDSSEVTKNMLNQLEDDSDEEYGPCTDEDHGQYTDGINIYDLDLTEGDTLYEKLYDEGLEDAEIKIDSEGNVLTYGLLPGDTISFVGAFTDSFPGKDQQEITEYLKNAYDIKVNNTDTDSSDEENNSDSELEIEDVKNFFDYMTKVVASAFNLTDKKDTNDIKNEMMSILSDLENQGVVEKDISENSQVKEPDDIKDYPFSRQKPMLVWRPENSVELKAVLATNVIFNETTGETTFYNEDTPENSLKIIPEDSTEDPVHKVIYLKLAQPIFYEGNGCYNVKLYYDKNGYIDSFSFIY